MTIANNFVFRSQGQILPLRQSCILSINILHSDALQSKISCCVHCIDGLRNCTVEMVDCLVLDICVGNIPDLRVTIKLKLPSSCVDNINDVIHTVLITTNSIDAKGGVEIQHITHGFFSNKPCILHQCVRCILSTSISNLSERRVAEVDLLQSDVGSRCKIGTSQLIVTNFLVADRLKVKEILVVGCLKVIEFCWVNNSCTNVVKNDVRECC